MARLQWDRVGTRTFESGLDRGVIYLPDGRVAPWSGLTELDEKPERNANPVYWDGRKISDGVTVGDFAASLSAVTYPDVVEELEGSHQLRRGVRLRDQPPKPFALCYRHRVGNDTQGDTVGYKIDIIWNVTLMPSDKSYASISDDPEIVEFSWDLVAVPEEISGVRPTAHLSLDTRYLDPWLIEDLEEILYGSTKAEASLMSMAEFVQFLDEWYRVKIVDNGDGTWTATEARPGFIRLVGTDLYELINVKAIYLDDDTYEISDTKDIFDVPRIAVQNNGDGTWTASSDNDAVFEIHPDGVAEIRAVDLVFTGPDMYQIDDQTSPH